jgi:hypothetical protein
MYKILSISSLILVLNLSVLAQSQDKSWFHIPGMTSEIIGKKQAFYGVMGLAAITYGLSEFVFKDSLNLNYYQTRLGANNEHFWAFRKVYYQNAGVEKRVSSYFAIAAELNSQQWTDNTPEIASKQKWGFGLGLMTYYRWYLFGKQRISPFFEYGLGVFNGFKRFPYNGSYISFNHSAQLGLEYTFKNKNKLRLAYGLFHQSNNYFSSNNPGYDANGFSLSYTWFWKTSRW